MRLPFFRLKRERSATAQGLQSIRSLFSKFQRIQKLNTRVLELMAEMEQALGGEYIFDRAFLERSVRQLSSLTYQVVYSINAMSKNGYLSLYDRFQHIKSILDDILGGGLGPFANSLTLPYSALSLEMEPLVGALNVCLAEAKARLDIEAPEGFAVTVTGCRRFMEANGIDGAAIPTANRKDVAKAIEDASWPHEMETAIQEELDRLRARRPALSHLSVRACPAGGPPGSFPELEGVTRVLPENVLAACKSALTEYVLKTNGSESNTSVALAIHEAVPAVVAGSIKSLASPHFSSGLFSVTAAPLDPPQDSERFLVRRIYPFELVQTDRPASGANDARPSSAKALERTSRRFLRGSSLLEPAFLQALAESTLSIERMVGCMQEIRWARGDSDRPILLDVRISDGMLDEGLPVCGTEDALPRADVLLTGGETVQTGVVAGRAVHVADDSDLQDFPHGGIAIVHAASPRLSLILRRASGIVTEIGSSIGHLATVARELRIPAVFGATGALARIPDGAEVTLDAGEQSVFAGVVESLLPCGQCGSELYPTDPEYATLRSLLRWIMPLDLIDPDSPNFSEENCRTYHDLIHFAHERSVEELLHIREYAHGADNLQARSIDLGIPAEIVVVDLGGGIRETTSKVLAVDDVTSVPFREFLRGLTLKEMWSCAPVAFRLRDIFSGLDRTFAAMTTPAEYSGVNHAIVGASYMNLGLRLGYHFSVIDSTLGDNINQNTVYFRFAGGFGDERKRALRARLIQTILEELRFKVMVKGDLVVGKLKIASHDEVAEALITLGQLTGFTRQLDLSMTSEEKIEQFITLFKQSAGEGRTFCQKKEAADG